MILTGRDHSVPPSSSIRVMTTLLSTLNTCWQPTMYVPACTHVIVTTIAVQTAQHVVLSRLGMRQADAYADS